MRVLLAVLLLLHVAVGVADEPIDIGSRRELFTDTTLIQQVGGQLQLRLHHPTPREIAMVHDQPWEGNNTTYHCVFKDGDLYRMFYVGRHSTMRKGQLHIGRSSFCYAESDDGIHWRKPKLGLCEFQGSKANNIVMDAAAAVRQARRDADGVQDNLAARDQRDSTRAASPLKVAEGATIINNAGETPEQTSARIMDLVKERLED